MPHPYVTKVTLTDGQIVLTVDLGEAMSGQPVEISGYATQNGGSFANFYDVQTVEANPDRTVVMYVKATPSQEFRNGQEVTVVLRAARVWATVLTRTSDGQMPPPGQAASTEESTAAQDGATWDIKTAAWLSPGPSPSWNPGQASAGGASFPAA